MYSHTSIVLCTARIKHGPPDYALCKSQRLCSLRESERGLYLVRPLIIQTTNMRFCVAVCACVCVVLFLYGHPERAVLMNFEPSELELELVCGAAVSFCSVGNATNVIHRPNGLVCRVFTIATLSSL